MAVGETGSGRKGLPAARQLVAERVDAEPSVFAFRPSLALSRGRGVWSAPAERTPARVEEEEGHGQRLSHPRTSLYA